MVRDDIFGMLKTALQRGKNLQQTAQSLYNSGYPKNEVDEAVQAINTYGFQQPVSQSVLPQKPIPPIKQPVQTGQTQQIVSAYPSIQYQQPPVVQYQQPIPPQFYYQPQPIYPQQFQPSPQIVSNYGQEIKPPKGKIMIIIMIAMLVVLIGILVAVFLFKDELTSFINNL